MRTFMVIVAAAALVAAVSGEMTATPLGNRPSQCVHEIPHGSHIEEYPGGVSVTTPEGEKLWLPELPECVEDMKLRTSLLQQARAQNGSVPSALGWLDYVDYTLTGSQTVGRFVSDYTVPQDPKQDGSQVLFYFIGTENIRSTTDLSILQPVLTWGNGINGWSYASWNCCPNGQQHKSTSLTGFGAGDKLGGEILDDGQNWSVMSTWNGKNSTLTVGSNGRHFDWLDVTLEVYNVAGCSEFADGPCTFDNMDISQLDGSPLVPSWNDVSGTTQCNGRITVDSPSKVVITHN